MSRLAWHFLHPGGRLRTGELAPPDGEWLIHGGDVRVCESGLHASERAVDALTYMPRGVLPFAARAGTPLPVLCRVEVRGAIHEDHDKLVASERRIVWRLEGDALAEVFHSFARAAAFRVIRLWDAPGEVTSYLMTGGHEESRRAAVLAASAAKRIASWTDDDKTLTEIRISEPARRAAQDGCSKSPTFAAAQAASYACLAAALEAGLAPGRGSLGMEREAAVFTARNNMSDVQNTHLEHLLNQAYEGSKA